MIPTGLPFAKIKALVTAVRVARNRLRAVGHRASVFTVGTLVEKLEAATQSSWCHYRAKQPGQVIHTVFKPWLQVEVKAAVVQRQNTLATQSEQGDAHRIPQPPPWAQSLHYNVAAKRNVTRTQTHKGLSYSTMTSADTKCPGRHVHQRLWGYQAAILDIRLRRWVHEGMA